MRTYSAAEVADRLGVSSKWLSNMASKQRVPHLLIARKLRFTEAHIAAIIEAYEVPITVGGDEDDGPPRRESRHYRNVDEA